MGSNMSSGEKAMYARFAAKNPGITEEDFMELRKLALSAKTQGAKRFYEVGGVLMQSGELPKGDEMKELTEDLKSGE